MKELIVEIKNKQGIHLLPATLIIKTLRKHASRLWIGKSVNRQNLTEITNLFELLGLSAGIGTELILAADGEDESQLLEELKRLIEVEKFGEE